MEYVNREAPITPVLEEMSKIVAPRMAAKGPAITPIKGIAWASLATGSPCGNSCHGKIPRPMVEKAKAKMNTVKIKVIEVRGMIVAGLLVSWAAWEIDSKPTKEMMAREEPYINSFIVGN